MFLVLIFASTQLCRLTAWSLSALVILISDRASGDLRGSGVLFLADSQDFLFIMFRSILELDIETCVNSFESISGLYM